jgi:hypothetical protein
MATWIYLSPIYPEMKLPMIAPRGTSDPIQELCSLLIGDPKGPPSFSKNGRAGLVHPSTVPAAATLRLAVEKSELQFPQVGEAARMLPYASNRQCHQILPLKERYREALIHSSRI